MHTTARLHGSRIALIQGERSRDDGTKPRASTRTVDYILDLLAKGDAIPGLPTERGEIAQLTQYAASVYIKLLRDSR